MKNLASIFCSILFATLSCTPLTSFAAAQTEQGFPRLGMWWPDPETQSLNDISRYDFITLFNYQSSFVAPLKA
ncbi:MAG: hypothetical protein V3W04_07420 [Gammaproteobacteria bacterium]